MIWIVNNCALLILGTIAGVMGVSFYLRNSSSAGSIRRYILFYGVFSALWCLSYAVLGVMQDISLCPYIRVIGLIAIDSFLMNEVFLVTEMADIGRTKTLILRIFAAIISIIDLLVFSNREVDIFVREDGYTRWYANPEVQLGRYIHNGYEVLMFLLLFILALIWLKKVKLRRSRKFMLYLFMANFSLLFFTIPDTVVPNFGLPGVATSGIGGAVCTIVMWYGAIIANSFNVSVGNITHRLFDFIEATGVLISCATPATS